MSTTTAELQNVVIALTRRCVSHEALAKAAGILIAATQPSPLNLPRVKPPVVRQPKAKATRARADAATLIPEAIQQALRAAAADSSIADVARAIGMPRTQLASYLKPAAKAASRVRSRLEKAVADLESKQALDRDDYGVGEDQRLAGLR